MTIDTLIINADLFTMKGAGVGFVSQGAVAVDKGKILAVGPTSELVKEYEASETIDATDKMVLPGFIDGHMHSFLNIYRGLAQDTKYWMMKGIRPFSSHVNKDSFFAASKLNVLEALGTGTTTFCDYSDAAVIFDMADFFDKLGVRTCLTSNIKETVSKKPVMDPNELYEFDENLGQKHLETNVALVERWHGKRNGRMNATLSPQAPDFLSTKTLLKVKEAAQKLDVKLHMHVAQGDRETIQMMKRYNKRSVQYLDELGYLDDRLIAVHLTEATEAEAALVAKRGASMVVCSGSIGIIDGVVPPAAAFIEAGGHVALGTDQPSGNNCSIIINEMKLTALFNKIRYADPEKMPAWQVLRMATIDGAKAIGMDHMVGSLETGKKADIIFIDLKCSGMSPAIRYPVRNHVPNLVYSARGHEVCRVMVDGQTLYLNGNHLTADETAIKSDVSAKLGAVLDSIPEEDIKFTVAYQYMQEEKL